MNIASDVRFSGMVERLVELARSCPEDYGDSFAAWEKEPSVRDLAVYLAKCQYPFLSTAVFHGRAWAAKIRTCKTKEDLADFETEAAAPGWSWNKKAEEIRLDNEERLRVLRGR